MEFNRALAGKTIAKLQQDGLSQSQIATKLNHMGICTPFGKKWANISVGSFLRNPRNADFLVPGDPEPTPPPTSTLPGWAIGILTQSGWSAEKKVRVLLAWAED